MLARKHESDYRLAFRLGRMLARSSNPLLKIKGKEKQFQNNSHFAAFDRAITQGFYSLNRDLIFALPVSWVYSDGQYILLDRTRVKGDALRPIMAMFLRLETTT